MSEDRPSFDSPRPLHSRSTHQLHGKINAKAWVYLTKQDDLECPSQADLNTLDERIKELTELVSTARDRIKHTSHQLAVDLATPTDAQLDELCPAAEKEREESSKRLGHLRSGAQTLITPQAMAQLRAETEAASTLIKKRKRKFEDIFGPIMEGTGKKRQELAEESDVSL